MVKLKQSGAVNSLVIVCIVLGVVLFATLAFGLWAFTSRQDYKNNADEKAATAAAAAKAEAEAAKDAEFAESSKQPTENFKAAETFGSLSFNYPRTWSVFSDTKTSSTPLNVTLHPGVVTNNEDAAYALRVQVADSSYDQVVKQFESAIKKGTLTSSPFSPKQVSGEVGLKLTGEIASKKTGVMIVLPLRDKTIKIWTESPDNIADLETFVLESLNYQP